MTPLQQRGFDDQRAGKLDPILNTAMTPAGQEYRDGTRQARRDAWDAGEPMASTPQATQSTAPEPVFIAHPALVEAAKAVFPPSVTVIPSAPLPVASGLHPTGQLGAFTDHLKGAKKPRKAKPAPAGQASLF